MSCLERLLVGFRVVRLEKPHEGGPLVLALLEDFLREQLRDPLFQRVNIRSLLSDM